MFVFHTMGAANLLLCDVCLTLCYRCYSSAQAAIWAFCVSSNAHLLLLLINMSDSLCFNFTEHVEFYVNTWRDFKTSFTDNIANTTCMLWTNLLHANPY